VDGIIRYLFDWLKGSKSEFSSLETSIYYRFKDKSLIKSALTHRSLAKGHQDNYERMEFLGDSIIESVLTDWLFHQYPEANEGILTNYRSSLVNKHFLATVACTINLKDYVLAEKCVNLNDKKVKNNIIADSFEALMGAIFLDGGIGAAKRSILKTIVPNSHLANPKNNYKGQLIEFCHRNKTDGPHFINHVSKGPDHEKLFNVEVRIGQEKSYVGSGKSKKEAEQDSAQKALFDLC
jgi:ribonuclease III